MKYLIPLYLTFNVLLVDISPGLAQNSLIENLLNTKKSIVAIKAWKIEYRKAPKVQAAFDPKSGKILIARQGLAAKMEKNGSGIILNSKGHIVTNVHTVKFADQIAVKLHNNETYFAKVQHVLTHHDLALIKIEPLKPLTPIKFANSDKVRLRDDVANIGNSDFLSNTFTGGVVTGLGSRNFGPNNEVKINDLIQVNMNLYKGDSGGPLLNSNGELIGIIVAKDKHKDRTTFAIPSNKIKNLYKDFVN